MQVEVLLVEELLEKIEEGRAIEVTINAASRLPHLTQQPQIGQDSVFLAQLLLVGQVRTRPPSFSS